MRTNKPSAVFLFNCLLSFLHGVLSFGYGLQQYPVTALQLDKLNLTVRLQKAFHLFPPPLYCKQITGNLTNDQRGTHWSDKNRDKKSAVELCLPTAFTTANVPGRHISNSVSLWLVNLQSASSLIFFLNMVKLHHLLYSHS